LAIFPLLQAFACQFNIGWVRLLGFLVDLPYPMPSTIRAPVRRRWQSGKRSLVFSELKT
jgi:hypothetical protein